MFGELLDHVDDRRSSSWRHSLTGAPSVDPLDQLGLDPNVDICVFCPMPVKWGAVGAPGLIIPAKMLIDATGAAEKGAKLPAGRPSLGYARRGLGET
jgi:hypothetical protein